MDDWVFCRNVVVKEVRCVGMGRKKDDMKLLCCSLNGQYSDICGGTSYMGQTSPHY